MKYNLQISLTTRCTSNCVLCLKTVLRNDFGIEENKDMSDDLIDRILNLNQENLNALVLCPNRGESLLHPKIDDFISNAKSKGFKIQIYTNGLYKPVEWWKEIAKIFCNKDNFILFAIDGISNETQRKYRRDSDFEKILQNMKTFVDNGGYARWFFILFEHNQHEIEKAKEIANELGIDIILRESFAYNDVVKKYTIKEDSLFSSIPKDSNRFPCSVNGWMEGHKGPQYYISTDGYFFPCCFMGFSFGIDCLRKSRNIENSKALFYYLKERESGFINVKNNSIETILKESKFIREVLKKENSICRQYCEN